MMDRGGGVKTVASFRKMPPPSKTHTIVAQVTVGELPPLPPSESRIAARQQIKHSGLRSTARHRVVASTVSEDRALGADCVKYDATSEDRGVRGYAGSVFIFNVYGFACLHPDRPTYIIQIEYSERRLPGESSLSSLAAEGEAFLNGLVSARFARPAGPVLRAGGDPGLRGIEEEAHAPSFLTFFWMPAR
jgi:hypothetical protein